MITIIKSKNGELTAKIDNNFVHSSYSPKKEAERFFQNQSLEKSKLVILIAPALNYLASIIQTKNPRCKIISVYLYKEFFNNDKNRSHAKTLFKDSYQLKTFLNENLSETNIEGLKIVESTSLTKMHPDQIKNIRTCLKQHISELHGNITTTSGFGKKFFSNFLKNYLLIDNYSSINKTNKPIIIAGAGPGLKSDLNFIKKYRDRFFILSIPSSFTFLKENNIKPDFIITTDPGYYAKRHLEEVDNTPLLMPFYASIPGNCYKTKIIPFLSNHFIEAKIKNNFNFINIPSNGTVAGSAVFASLALTSSYIFLSGLDFSFIDCLSHIRPHSFDNLLESNSDRFNTINTLYFTRNITTSKKIDNYRRQSHSLNTYHGWFSSISEKLKDRCFFINYYAKPPGTFKSLNYDEILKLTNKSFQTISFNTKHTLFLERKNDLLSLLNNQIDYLDKIKKQINSLNNSENIFNLLNNDINYNLFLPELLEYKSHYENLSLVSAKNKAKILINKSINFLEESINYVR